MLYGYKFPDGIGLIGDDSFELIYATEDIIPFYDRVLILEPFKGKLFGLREDLLDKALEDLEG